MKDFLMWNKITRIIHLLAKELNIPPRRALDIYYSSHTCKLMQMQQSGLYCMSDAYIVDELIAELRQKQ